jgi:hypothetical protein
VLEQTKLVTAHPALPLAPPVERDLADPELLDRLCHRQALAIQNLRLPQLADDFLKLVTLPRHQGASVTSTWSDPTEEGHRDSSRRLSLDLPAPRGAVQHKRAPDSSIGAI